MRKIFFVIMAILIFSTWLSAQPVPVIIGEHIKEQTETPHPYSKEGVIPGELNLVHSDTVAYPGATYIALHFALFDLAEGDFAIVRSPDDKQSYMYSNQGRANLGISADGFFATHIKGDTAIIEIYSDNEKRGVGYLIDFFGRGYNEEEIQHYWDIGLGEEMHLPRPPGLEESICTTDDTKEAKCYETSEPEAYDKARAVCRLMLNGNAHCTGWLIGSEGHIMTNEHCIGSQSQLNTIDFEFMAEGANCATNCASALACPGKIEASGGTLISVNATYDYSLVMPDTSTGGGTNLPATYGFMRLRPSGAVVGERLYIAQHPAGWGKRLAMESSYPDETDGFAHVVSLDEPACSGGGSNVDVGYWADTQGGSSGSPVLGYSDNLIIALHHCQGNAACTTGNPGSDDPNRGVPIQDVIAALGPDLPIGAVCDPPDTPSSLTATTNGDNTIDLSWSPVAGADTYNVFRAQGPCGSGIPTIIASGIASASYSDQDVSGGTTYNYQVSAFIASTNCESETSNCAEDTAIGLCTLPPVFAGLQSADNAFTGTCGINLTWSEATAPACGANVTYSIYRDTMEGFFPGPSNLIASCLTETTYLDQDLIGNTLYYYIVRAEDDSTNGSGPCAMGNIDTNRIEKSAFASGPNDVMFFDDVEAGNSNFTAISGIPGKEPWIIVDPTHPLGNDHYYSPTHSWFCSDETTAKDESLATTSPISLPDQFGLILRWFQEVEMEDGWDGCVLEYSLDGAAWFDILLGDGDSIPANPDRFLMNAYNMTMSSSSNVLSGRRAWSGDLGGYDEVQVDLTDFHNRSVYFRWRVGTDGSVKDLGWWIDDIEILFPTACSALQPVISIGSYNGVFNDSFSLDVTQLDTGTLFDQFGFDVLWDPTKIAYQGNTPGTVGSCGLFDVVLVEPGKVHVSSDCSPSLSPGNLCTLDFTVIGLTGITPVSSCNFSGGLQGKSGEDGLVTLPASVDPCTLPGSVYFGFWNHDAAERDLDLDSDGRITINDMAGQVNCSQGPTKH